MFETTSTTKEYPVSTRFDLSDLSSWSMTLRYSYFEHETTALSNVVIRIHSCVRSLYTSLRFYHI